MRSWNLLEKMRQVKAAVDLFRQPLRTHLRDASEFGFMAFRSGPHRLSRPTGRFYTMGVRAAGSERSMERSDKELLNEIAGGDVDAYAAFYDRHAGRVLGLLLKI